MNKGFILVNMPDKCHNCRMGFKNEYYNQFECYFEPGTEIKPDEEKPDWCPIMQIPDMLTPKANCSSEFADGFNTCVEGLLEK